MEDLKLIVACLFKVERRDGGRWRRQRETEGDGGRRGDGGSWDSLRKPEFLSVYSSNDGRPLGHARGRQRKEAKESRREEIYKTRSENI
jgi:hypothetical protein